MSDILRNDAPVHEVTMKNRSEFTVGGVTDVVSFDDSAVVLKTVCGELEITGEGLKMSAFDTSRGSVSVDGKVQSLTYYDKKKEGGKGVIGRFFG